MPTSAKENFDEGFFIGFFIGVLVGVLLMGILLEAVYAPKPVTMAEDAVKECEKSLPRDQTCEYVITARVVE